MFACGVQAKNILPDTLTTVALNNQNPNHIVCVDGDVNDYYAPKHIPIEVTASGQNLFVAYLFQSQMAGLTESYEFVSESHIMHITCNGLVYSLKINPVGSATEKIYLGDPNLASLKQNAELVRTKSAEDLIVELTLATINNDLPPQYSVTRLNEVMPPVFAGLKIVKRRKVALNGVGLVLVEYEIFSDSVAQLTKKAFIRREFSNKMRSISLVPETVTPSQPARLFIVEDK